MRHKVTITIKDGFPMPAFGLAISYEPPLKSDGPLSPAQYLADYINRNSEEILKRRSRHESIEWAEAAGISSRTGRPSKNRFKPKLKLVKPTQKKQSKTRKKGKA